MGEKKFQTLGILVLLVVLVECGPLERPEKPKEGLPREEILSKDKIPRPGPQPGVPDTFGPDLGHPPPEILPSNPEYDDEDNDIERDEPGKRFPPDFDRDEGPKFDDEDGEKSFDKEDDVPDKESDDGKIPVHPASEGEEESIHKDVDESDDEEPPKKDDQEGEVPPEKDEEEDAEPPEKDEEEDEESPEKDDDKPVHEETDEPHGGGEDNEPENVPNNEDGYWGFKKRFGFGESSLFDSPFFNLDQVRKYFGQLEKALGHVFRQTMDEARLLNGTYANTTEEEVDINGKKYIVQKSVIKGADNHSTIYVETLSSRPKGTGDEKVVIENL